MRMRAIRLLLCVCIACAAAVTASSADCAGGAETVRAEILRSGPGAEFSALTELPDGMRLVVNAPPSGGWYSVTFDGTPGYISGDALNVREAMELFATGRITGEGVPLRAGPEDSAPTAGVTYMGQAVTVTGVDGAWYRVAAGFGTGYIRSDYLWLISAAGNTDAEKAVELALRYLDYPYVWAAASPEKGFDCSGFVTYVLSELGYSTYRTAADLYAYDGSAVSYSELLPGDCVFFHSSSEWVGHVGIYLGDGLFVHSSSGAGKVVISGLEDAYYARNYVGAKRIADAA